MRAHRGELLRIGISLALFVAGLLLPGWWGAGALILAWLVAGCEVLYNAGCNILRGQFLDEEFLMAVATICALAMQEWSEAAAVMIFFQIGELFEHMAVARSRESIASLMDLRPDFAVVLRDGEEITLEPEEVQIGDVLLIRPSERIAVDGQVIQGQSALDTSKITGEALPVDVEPGSNVVSGSVNLTGVLQVRAQSAYEESTVARILTLVETGAEQKAKTERLITRFAHWYTPCVLVAAILLTVIPPVFFGQAFSEWLRRALTFLVISCPCALVISVPLSFFSGMGAAAKLGVIVKGGVALENLAKVDAVLFDKTGTLTHGTFTVHQVHPVQGSAEELLTLAAACERYSNHPVAAALRDAANETPAADEICELPGRGITARVAGRRVAVGNEALLRELGLQVPACDLPATVVYVTVDGAYRGYIAVGDQLRQQAEGTIQALKKGGMDRLVMLTGDNEAAAKQIAAACGLEEYRASLLPQDKVSQVRRVMDQGHRVAFVGDGVNDAPVLALADVGLAMGGVGTDAAVEAADAVILNDDISKLPRLLRLARRTCSIARQNIAFALAIKGGCLVLGALGLAPMWLAIFADVGVAVIAICNAFRALRVPRGGTL